MFSLEGDGGRRELDTSDEFMLELKFAQGSGDVGIGGGVSTGGVLLASDKESAWKNLLSGGGSPREDKGGEGTSGVRVLSSCCPLA